jgi:hypothetical protein
MVVPSGMVESMNVGAYAGLAALGSRDDGPQARI